MLKQKIPHSSHRKVSIHQRPERIGPNRGVPQPSAGAFIEVSPRKKLWAMIIVGKRRIQKMPMTAARVESIWNSFNRS